MTNFWRPTCGGGPDLPHVEYLGCYRPCEECDGGCDPARDGALFGGWARRGPSGDPEFGSRQPTWRVMLGHVAVELLVGQPEAQFLAHCLENALQCWVVGRLLLMRTLLPAAVHVVAAFPPVGSDGPLPRVVPLVAEALCASAMREALRAVRTPPEQRPTLMLQGMELLEPRLTGLHSDLAGPVVFAARAEAAALTGLASYQGQDVVRLGLSRFAYRFSTQKVEVPGAPSALPPEPLRGCLLVGHRPKLLLSVARLLLASTPPSLRSLVLCGRDELPFVVAALEAEPLIAARLHVAATATALAAPAYDAAAVVVAPLWLLENVQVMATLARVPWHRLLSVGWPEVSRRLCREVIGALRCATHLALATAEALREQAAHVDRGTVAHLLGLQAAGLNDAGSLVAALHERVLHVDAPHSPQVRGYRLALAPPDEQELLGLDGVRGAQRTRRLFFPLFCELSAAQRANFPPLRDGTPAEHFARLGGALSSYAEVALASSEGQDCPICFEAQPPVVTRCGHRYCEDCLRQALARRRSCPACREALQPQRDIVVLRPPVRSGLPSALMRRLAVLLGDPAQRTLVVASFGDVHERLAQWLRRQGRARTWAWRGNTQQRLATLRRFELHADAALLVDPTALALHWASFDHVDRVLLLWPLLGSDPCCQLRRLYAAVEHCASVTTVLVTPAAAHEPAELRSLSEGCLACQRHGAVVLAPASAASA